MQERIAGTTVTKRMVNVVGVAKECAAGKSGPQTVVMEQWEEDHGMNV